MNKDTAAKSSYGTTGEYRQFERGTIYASKKGTNMVYGEIWKQHQASGGTGGEFGFPTGSIHRDDNSGRLCQGFEAGKWICGESVCEKGEEWDNESRSCKQPPCPKGYSIYDGICKKDFLGGSVHPLSKDSNCIDTTIVYSGDLSINGDYGEDDYGIRPHIGDFHYGVDIRSLGAMCKVNSVAGGFVTIATTDDGKGAHMVDVNHGEFTTRYLHGQGLEVKANQNIYHDYLFTMACTGICNGRHLHFDLFSSSSFIFGDQLDPQLQNHFGYMRGPHNSDYLPAYYIDLNNKIYYVTKEY